MRPLKFLLLLFAAGFLSGCAPQARMNAVRPAQISLPGVRTLAVGRFSGRYGDEARYCFLTAMRSSDRFFIVEQVQGSEAAVTAVVAPDVRTQRGTDTVRYTDTATRRVTITDENGDQKTITEEVSTRRTARVAWVERDLRVDADMAVHRPGQAYPVVQRSVYEDRDGRWGGREAFSKCDDYKSSAPTLDEMPDQSRELAEMACDAGTRLALQLIPEQYSFDVPLDEEGGDLVARGAELADGGDWNQAVLTWRNVLATDPGNASALYNLGVHAEREGTVVGLQRAARYYHEAYGAMAKELYREARLRAESRVRDLLELQRRMEGGNP